MMKKTPPRVTLENVGQEDADRAQAILASVATEHGVTPADILSRGKLPKLVGAKRAAALAMELVGFSTPVIALFLGGIHHTSVMHLLGRTGVAKARAARKESNAA